MNVSMKVSENFPNHLGVSTIVLSMIECRICNNQFPEHVIGPVELAGRAYWQMRQQEFRIFAEYIR